MVIIIVITVIIMVITVIILVIIMVIMVIIVVFWTKEQFLEPGVERVSWRIGEEPPMVEQGQA